MHHPRLKIQEQPFKTICHSLGGIHKAIQILDMLTPKTEFFSVEATREDQIKSHHVKQYRLDRNRFKALSPYSRVWHWLNDECSLLAGKPVYDSLVFINELEHAISHVVHIPENVYFQTLDRINLLRNQTTDNKKASV